MAAHPLRCLTGAHSAMLNISDMQTADAVKEGIPTEDERRTQSTTVALLRRMLAMKFPEAELGLGVEQSWILVELWVGQMLNATSNKRGKRVLF